MVFWGKNATKWSPLISERSIIRVQWAKVCTPNSQWKGLVAVTANTELNIQANTTITFEDEKFLDPVVVNSNPVVYEEILLQDIAAHQDKKINVKGWIKVPFQHVTFGGGSRGCGSIVDHEWRIRVTVRLFLDNPLLKKGSHVSVNDGSSLICDNIGDVVITANENILSEDELNGMGFYTPKRKIEGDTEKPSSKRSPFDN
ncbi:uncharacterized protein LOC130674950 isoform X2 [Microplitis mediator]|uniref:uncharacterized protein LOC130674950 isoform X2 n=1 Tax=Microplitis mediator TaxID=375433 RepID=UPI0025572AC9|nr:uncharacterized protein LOC130674950 isoform X2 [Microplitis mediator]